MGLDLAAPHRGAVNGATPEIIMTVALITGTTGFLGGHLSRALRATHEIVPLNRGRDLASGSLSWDFHSPLPADLPDRVDVVVHCASPVGAACELEQQACWDANLQGTVQLLGYARRAKASCFAYISSGAVYGFRRNPCREIDAITPQGSYACAKAAGEFIVRGHQMNLRTLCLRPFYPYGPGQRMSRLVPGLIERLRTNQCVPLNGPEGLPRVNPLYIDDLAAWMVQLLARNASGVFNLAGLETVSIRELADQLAALLKRKASYRIRLPDGENSLGDISRVIAVTGYQPRWTLASGLRVSLQTQAGNASSNSTSFEHGQA